MNDFTIHRKTIETLVLILGMLFFSSCKNENNGSIGNEAISKIQNPKIKEKLLIGSWKDTSESALDFTLFKNGTARSDNMKTLLYKNWKVNGNQITFTVESIGNGTSSTENITYCIEKLADDQLNLKKGAHLYMYTKK